MIKSLSLLDIFLIGCYFVVVLYIGYQSGKNESNEGFLLADRELGAWESAATICASKTGAGVFLTYIAFVYMFGISAIWSFIGTTLGYIFFYWFASRLKALADLNQYYTLSDYFLKQFGRLPGFASAFTLLLIYILGFAAQLVGGSKVLATLTGSSYWLSLLIMSTLIISYILFGGFKAVVKTDILQYVAIVLLTVLLAIFLGFNIDNIQFDNLSFKPNIALALFLGSIIVPFSSAELWQRVYATKGQSQAKKSLLYAMIMYLAFGLILTLVGYIIKGVIVTEDTDLALVLGFQQLLPSGLMGFSVVILYAAVMSSADTNLFTSASIVVLDFWSKLSNTNDKSKLVYGIRLASLLIGLSSVLVALLFPEMVKIGFIWLSLNIALGVIVIISWLFKNIDVNKVSVGIIAGTVCVLICTFFFRDQRLIFVALTTGPILVLLLSIANILTAWRK
jgi:Na+/proline symporter